MRILITGGAGQVGRKLRRELASHYSAIRSFDTAAHTPLRVKRGMRHRRYHRYEFDPQGDAGDGRHHSSRGGRQ